MGPQSGGASSAESGFSSADDGGVSDVQIIKDIQGELTDSSPSSEATPGPRRSTLATHADFVRLQAILAGLPMHALRGDPGCGGGGACCCCASRRGGCLCCCHPRVLTHMPWVLPCNERIEVALLAARSLYPQFQEQLKRLRVAHASYDLTIFVDDAERRMFTSMRGTDCLTCRDISNDVLIFFGCWLCRTKWAREEYCHTRSLYPDYASFGCGHSLGGTVMTELAHLVEGRPEFAFQRVDVFNTGGSPIAFGYNDLKVTKFRSHRVQGDLVSRFFRGPGERYEHPRRPEYCSHSLEHFLPDKMPGPLSDIQAWVQGCCGGGRHLSDREQQLLMQHEAAAARCAVPGGESEGEEGRPGPTAARPCACSEQCHHDDPCLRVIAG